MVPGGYRDLFANLATLNPVFEAGVFCGWGKGVPVCQVPMAHDDREDHEILDNVMEQAVPSFHTVLIACLACMFVCVCLCA